MSAEDKQIIEIDEDEDFDFDDDIEVADTTEDTAPTKSKEGGKEDTMSEFEKKLNKKLDARFKEQHNKLTTYVDQRVNQVNEKVNTNASEIDKLSERIAKIEEISQAVPKTGTTAPQQEEKKPNLIDATFGTVGGLLHGIVDTSAYVLESTIDIVTLGKAKRN